MFDKYKKLISKCALFLVAFMSLAPSISHAMQSTSSGDTLFFQEVCTSGGEVISIQVVTKSGQELSINLNANNQTTQSSSVISHFNHCPFCINPGGLFHIYATNQFNFTKLVGLEKVSDFNQVVVYQTPKYLYPPSMASPILFKK